MSVAPARIGTARSYAPRRTAVAAPSPRARLRIVPNAAPDATRAPFFALCAAILVAALLGALALNTTMAATSYTLRDRASTLASLEEQRETLATDLENTTSPAQLTLRAQQLGLVPSDGVTYVRLSDHTLIGGQGAGK